MRKSSDRHLVPGHVVAGRYKIGELLGRGGSGIVFCATDEQTGRRIAFKTLLPAAAARERHRARFMREARLVTRLQNHHTVRFLDVGFTEAGVPFLAMELLTGLPLNAKLAADGTLSIQGALDLADQVLQCLIEAHELGIVHRDIKPANIFLAVQEEQQVVKVMDFGLARSILADAVGITSMGEAVGTLPYMAPEYLIMGTISHSMDIYAAGLLIHECIIGRTPYYGMGLKKIQLAKQHEVQFDAETVRALGDAFGVVIRAVQNVPSRRYASAKQMRAHIQEVRGQTPNVRPTAWINPGQHLPRPARPSRHTTDYALRTLPPTQSDEFPVVVNLSPSHRAT